MQWRNCRFAKTANGRLPEPEGSACKIRHDLQWCSRHALDDDSAAAARPSKPKYGSDFGAGHADGSAAYCRNEFQDSERFRRGPLEFFISVLAALHSRVLYPPGEARRAPHCCRVAPAGRMRRSRVCPGRTGRGKARIDLKIHFGDQCDIHFHIRCRHRRVAGSQGMSLVP